MAYISNHINDYSLVLENWGKFFKNRHQLDFYCVVGEAKGNFASLVMERIFFKNSTKQFNDLEKAIAWSLIRIEEREAKKSSALSANMK